MCNIYPVLELTVLYVHLLGDEVRAGSGKAVSSRQHPVLTHDGSKARGRVAGVGLVKESLHEIIKCERWQIVCVFDKALTLIKVTTTCQGLL